MRSGLCLSPGPAWRLAPGRAQAVFAVRLTSALDSLVIPELPDGLLRLRTQGSHSKHLRWRIFVLRFGTLRKGTLQPGVRKIVSPLPEPAASGSNRGVTNGNLELREVRPLPQDHTDPRPPPSQLGTEDVPLRCWVCSLSSCTGAGWGRHSELDNRKPFCNGHK